MPRTIPVSLGNRPVCAPVLVGAEMSDEMDELTCGACAAVLLRGRPATSIGGNGAGPVTLICPRCSAANVTG